MPQKKTQGNLRKSNNLIWIIWIIPRRNFKKVTKRSGKLAKMQKFKKKLKIKKTKENSKKKKVKENSGKTKKIFNLFLK